MRFKTGDTISGDDDSTGEVIVGIIRGVRDNSYIVQWLDLDPAAGPSYVRVTAEKHLERTIIGFAGPVPCGRGQR
jgi:hypothetical protein